MARRVASRTAAARRSAAARKGWSTRRRQARERSDRARKGWETRRRRARELEKKKKKRKKKKKEQPPKPPPARGEFAVSADYKTRRGRSVSIQLAIFGPANATHAQISRAILEKAATKTDPDGWELRIVDWRNRGQSGIRQSREWRNFSRVLANSDFEIDENRES